MKANCLRSLLFAWAFLFVSGLPAHSFLTPRLRAADNCQLPSPASLNATIINSTSASFTWTAVSSASGYRVRLYALSDMSLVADNLTLDLYTTFGGLSAGASYRCAVSAVCSGETQNTISDNLIVIDIILNNSSPGNETAPAITPEQPANQILPVQNPFHEVLRLSVAVSEPLSYHLQLIRTDGSLAFEQNGVTDGEGELAIPTEAFEKGMYFLRIEAGDRVQVFRVLKW